MKHHFSQRQGLSRLSSICRRPYRLSFCATSSLCVFLIVAGCGENPGTGGGGIPSGGSGGTATGGNATGVDSVPSSHDGSCHRPLGTPFLASRGSHNVPVFE